MDRKKQKETATNEEQAKCSGRCALCLAPDGNGATESVGSGEFPISTANEYNEPLAYQLMERVVDPDNMNRAYKRVVSNKGAAGVDRMTVDQLKEWIRHNKKPLLTSLLDGSYRPQPVLGVKIPKPAEGLRQLGIPTVVDRLVQQAITQVLEPLLDSTFSESSYGFRPKRSAHDALRQASKLQDENTHPDAAQSNSVF